MLDFVLHELVRIMIAQKISLCKSKGGRNMEYLTLQNGVQMPLVGFGTFMLSGETCVISVSFCAYV